MIFGGEKSQVIERIRQAAREGNFHAKTELGDPCLNVKEREALLSRFMEERGRASFRLKRFGARCITDGLTWYTNRDTEILGVENLRGVPHGAIVTSNHFSPLDNGVIRFGLRTAGWPRVRIVAQETNFAMGGLVGFLMHYSDTLPVSGDRQYMARAFPCLLKEALDRGNPVLIYPEQEMWFHYRKPRPLKRGAYHYAAKFGVPVVSCFVEIREKGQMDTEEFRKVRYVLHILPPIYPEPGKGLRENSVTMCQTDYRQKQEAYQKAYGRPLDYAFTPHDIAGWAGEG